jgi:hypothetical protein
MFKKYLFYAVIFISAIGLSYCFGGAVSGGFKNPSEETDNSNISSLYVLGTLSFLFLGAFSFSKLFLKTKI